MADNGDGLLEQAENERDGNDLVSRLLGKSWDELQVLEHAGYLLFPNVIRRRVANGKFEDVKVMIRLPRNREFRQARVEAREIALKDGIDLDRDKDLFEDIETACILARAIRNSTPPHEPYEPDPGVLEQRFDRSSLARIWRELDVLHKLVDPSDHLIRDEELFALVAAIAREQSIGPLADYDAASRAYFTITTVSLLWGYMGSKSSLEPSASSTPGS